MTQELENDEPTCPRCGHNEATKEPVYTTPPQRKPLTEQFIMDSTRELSRDFRWPSSMIDVWRLCEAAHGIKE